MASGVPYSTRECLVPTVLVVAMAATVVRRRTGDVGAQRIGCEAELVPMSECLLDGRRAGGKARDLRPVSLRQTILIVFLLILLNLVIYWRVYSFGFAPMDDRAYVAANAHVKEGLTLESIKYAFTTDLLGGWIPLTWLTYFVDSELYGLNPGGYHVTNVLFHMANTALLFIFLMRTTGAVWRSAFVAALFAVHPMHVESVAWISERKDVLSTFFWMLTMIAYAEYAVKPRLRRYVAVFCLLSLGLMAKTMLVTLPCVLLLMDFWPLGRAKLAKPFSAETAKKWGALVLEKVPLVLVSAGASLLAVRTQSKNIIPIDVLPIQNRIANAAESYFIYIRKMVWPRGLAGFYTGLDHTIPLWQTLAALSVIIVVALLAFRLRNRAPYLLVGWLWYLGTMIPVIGLVQIFIQYTADRYTYLPYTGLFIMITWGAWEASERVGLRRLRPGISLVGAAVLLACIVVSSFQVGTWKNEETHAKRQIEVNFPDDYLGASYFEAGEIDLAIVHFERSIERFPERFFAYEGLGHAYMERKDFELAENSFRAALALKPGDAWIHAQLANALTKQEKIAEASEQYREVLKVDAENVEALSGLGSSLLLLGDPEGAIEPLELCLSINPRQAAVLTNLGAALLYLRRMEEAAEALKSALVLNSEDEVTLVNLAVALYELDERDEADKYCREALRVNPEYEQAKRFLAIMERGTSDEQ